MRLLSYHIQNFGKLQNIRGYLESGLTVIKEDNSFGKTTLAEFIISMFYGLPDLKKKDLENERRRYDPWQGGIYGGSLTFEFEGRRYQIDRDFHKNSFELWDITSVRKKAASIWGKPADGARLGEILFEINKESFKRSAYIPQDDIVCHELDSGLNDKMRNMINATDRGHSLESALKVLQKAADDLETKKAKKGKIKDIEDRIWELNEKLADCAAHLKSAEKGKKDLEEKKGQLEKLEQDIKKLEDEINSLNKLNSLQKEQEHYFTLKGNVEKDEREIRGLLPFFKGQSIENISLDEIRKTIEAHDRQREKAEWLEQEKNKLHSIKDEEQNRQNRISFYRIMIKNLEKQANDTWLEKERKESEIARLEGKLRKFKGFLYILLCILSFGVYYLIARAKKKRISAQLVALRADVEACERKLEELAPQMEDFKERAKREGQAQEEFDEAELEQIKARLDKERELSDNLERQIQDYLSRFLCASKDFWQCYYEIEGNYNQLLRLSKSLEESKARLEEFLADKDEEKLSAKLGLAVNTDEPEQERKKLYKYKEELLKEISAIETRIKDDEEEAENISIYQGELEELNQIRDYLKIEFDNLQKAMEFLKEANDSLAGRYLSPLLEKCRQLIRLYDEGKSELAVVENYRILIKENGIDRELGYYSKGLKEIISICMRLAMIEVIYGDKPNKPFIILDDPFANLDDRKLEQAKEFVKRLSQEYQIIYLTCHGSRQIAV